MIAFLTSVTEKVGGGRFIHMGPTSSDILDTSLAVLRKRPRRSCLRIWTAPGGAKMRAFEHKRTLMIGPPTAFTQSHHFRLKMALW